MIYGISVSDMSLNIPDATHSNIDNNGYRDAAVVGGREEEGEVHAKLVLKPGQGSTTGNHDLRQEASTNYDGKLQAPDEQANQFDDCENAQWFANSSHSR